MKSIIAKLVIVGFLAGALLAFCPVVMPVVNQALTPPVLKQPEPDSVVEPHRSYAHPEITDLNNSRTSV